MIITLCGSTQFKEDYIEMCRQLEYNGHTVLTGCTFTHADNLELSPEERIHLDNAQKHRISICDAIFVINKDNYIGENTYSDIDWAQRNKKEVYFLVNPNPEEDKEEEKTPTTEPTIE